MSIQNFKAVILLIISILIQQLHLELFGGTTLESLAFKHCTDYKTGELSISDSLKSCDKYSEPQKRHRTLQEHISNYSACCKALG